MKPSRRLNANPLAKRPRKHRSVAKLTNGTSKHAADVRRRRAMAVCKKGSEEMQRSGGVWWLKQKDLYTAEKQVEDLHPKRGKVITCAIINDLFISLSCKLT